MILAASPSDLPPDPMHLLARIVIACTLIAVILFGCKTSPRYQKGGTTTQSFPALSAPMQVSQPAPAPAPAEGQSQTLAQPENAQGPSKQDMVEERTVMHPDGSVERTKRTAATVIGGSQSLTDILKTYYDDQYTRRLVLAILLGLAAWYLRNEWPVKAGVLAAGAVLTAFFGPVAAAIAASICAGIFVAYHVLKSRIPIPLP